MSEREPVRLILSHDNADFDAVAAMLAAHKLDPAARPVLPARVNRNVGDFLNLYRSALPFIARDDLRRGGNVEHVTVVDTQSFSTVRGMRPDTPVHFIDHHPLTRDLAAHQQFSGEPVGAATTLLAEQLQARQIALAPLEATLLMLGVYEDTGALVYGTTTPRDIRCAAWLLEAGADLDVVRDFLQHRLSPEQHDLYDRLLEGVEAHDIGGHAVVVARARVPEPVEEIATLAHKLRELFDPAAIFVLVQFNGDIQLVARSTTDAIDVSQIALRFGGGGHGRAAAALIRQRALDTVHRAILDALPEIVSASVRVEDLMSMGVQTIRADEHIKAAADRMRRLGHEGFPVVAGEAARSSGELVGLLTRSAVDRALSHGLGGDPVRTIMDAGQVTVRPRDSIELLQQRMMRSGWGQVPVVDDAGALLGIVTRTDLIKRWGQRADTARRAAILERMADALTPALWTLLQRIAAQAQQMGMGLYMVGGFVRDLLLDRPNMDIDLVVEGDALALADALRAAYGGARRSHAQFGTAKWLLTGAVAAAFDLGGADSTPENGGTAWPDGWPDFIDFATARREFYEQPTALPTVERGSIKPDLGRRDFTINTLAIRLAPEPMGDLLDFFGGEQDLRDGVIKVLHSLSFVDDPTRMLRAVRLEQRLGFAIEPRTEELIQGALGLLPRVSGDRIRHELALILAEPEPLDALARLEALGILAALHPDLHINAPFRRAVRALRTARKQPPWPTLRDFDDWMLTSFALLTSHLDAAELEDLGHRLQFSRENLTHLHAARTALDRLPTLAQTPPPSAVVALLDDLDEVGWLAAWALAGEHAPAARPLIERFAREWRFVKPTLNGRDIQRLTGLKPGPAYRELLLALRDAWLDGAVQTPDAEEALLHHLVETLEKD